MSKKQVWTTYNQTGDGRVYDLGKGEYHPRHQHKNNGWCPKCFVVRAWTAPRTSTPAEDWAKDKWPKGL